jgi:hypothetical protein
MKTVQISDELWRRLKVEAALRGVTVRSLMEGMGAEWLSRTGSLAVTEAAWRGALQAGSQRAESPTQSVRALTVEPLENVP